MTIPNSLGDYKVVSDKVKDVLSRRIDVVNPFLDASRSDASGLEPFRSVLASGRKTLPRRYHTLYLEVLEAALGLRSPEAARLDLDRAHRVGFGAGFGHGAELLDLLPAA